MKTGKQLYQSQNRSRQRQDQQAAECQVCHATRQLNRESLCNDCNRTLMQGEREAIYGHGTYMFYRMTPKVV